MKQRYESKELSDSKSSIVAAHTIDIVCDYCGFDVDENDLNSDKCPDCGAPLELKQNITVEVAPLVIFVDTSG